MSRQSAIAQIAGGLFALLEQYENRWPVEGKESESADLFGQPYRIAGKSAGTHEWSYLSHFVEAFPALQDQWRLLLTHHTFAEVEHFFQALQHGDASRYFGDAAWVRVVYESASAWRRRILPRNQILGLFTPLLLGRLGSFALKTKSMDQTGIDAELARLATYFEALQPAFQRLWQGRSLTGSTLRVLANHGQGTAR